MSARSIKRRDFRQSAKHFGYKPWNGFTYWEWIEINKIIQQSTLNVLRRKLRNPGLAAPAWLVQFAAACEKIGLDTCLEQKNIHYFVTKHPAFAECLSIKRQYQAACITAKEAMKLYIRNFDEADAKILEDTFKTYVKVSKSTSSGTAINAEPSLESGADRAS
jgi:hypothetical protein